MSKKGLHIFFLFLLFSQGYSQSENDSLALNFHLEFNKLPLELNKKYISANKDTLTIETFRCYISNIQVQYNDNSLFVQKNSYHLLDSGNPDSFRIPIAKKSNKTISKVMFNIGIDSLTNTSGALSGDLDPAKGMYWAWQSGYINMKIEGRSPSCKTRKNEFHFHIGGYLKPYYAMRPIEIPIQKNQGSGYEINIGIDLGKFFSQVRLKETNSVMILGKEAVKLADLSAEIFSLE